MINTSNAMLSDPLHASNPTEYRIGIPIINDCVKNLCRIMFCPECKQRVFDLIGILGESTSVQIKCPRCRLILTF
jgi:hypothetical protein